MTSRWRTSRFAPSELKFGAPGRVLATVLFLSPVYFGLDLAGVFGVVFVVPYVIMVVPDGLRWLWQPVRVELIADPSAADPPPGDPPPPGAGIADRQAPSRW